MFIPDVFQPRAEDNPGDRAILIKVSTSNFLIPDAPELMPDDADTDDTETG
jgi:hypothetical protein